MKNYNHYWQIDGSFKLTSAQRKLIKEVLDHRDDSGQDRANFVKAEYNNTKGISLYPVNGQEGSEFTVDYTLPIHRGVVDTARNHWDYFVMRILLVLSLSDNFNFWSEGIDMVDGKFKFDCDWEGAIDWFNKKGYGKQAIASLVWTTIHHIEEESPTDTAEGKGFFKSLTAEPQFCGMYEFIGQTDKGNSSAKFWEIHPHTEGYKAGWGKIGHGWQGTKIYTYAEAVKVVNKKMQNGYVKQ